MSTRENTKEPELQVMVWYNKEDWENCLSLFDDAQLLPKNYNEWHKRANAMVSEVEASGDLVVKVTIDTVLFPAWCKEKGRKMDADSRTTFAIEAVQRQQFLNNM